MRILTHRSLLLLAVLLSAGTDVIAQQPATPDSTAAEATARGTVGASKDQKSDNGTNTTVSPKGVAVMPQKFSEDRALPREPARTLPPALGRKRIGLALGGGGALALSEVGVLRWFDEHHIPVDAIAGTSMGSLVGALYATGHSPQQIGALTSDRIFSSVFRLDQDFRQLNFRRRDDARFLPGGFNLGLKHGVSLRNGVLLDYGLNQFLNAQFLPYGAAYNFDTMPIPFRCVATDILVGREAVFDHGPLAEAVRASISIPGVFPPLADGGHIYVDGALTENLPVDVVKQDLHADVVVAVSLPLTPPDRGDTNSVLGILQRSFSVASWSNEVRSRGLADVVIEPLAPAGVGTADYAKADALAQAGYDAAEKISAKLLPLRLDDAAWAIYTAQREGRFRGSLGNIAAIRVIAPSQSAANGVRDTVTALAGRPLRPDAIDSIQNQIRSDGRFNSDYFLTLPGQQLDTDVTGPANLGHQVDGRELLHPKETRGPGDEIASKYADPAADAPGTHGAALSNVPVNNTIPVGSRETKPAETTKGKPLYETVAPESQTRVSVAAVPAPGAPGPGDEDLNFYVRDKPGGPPFLLLGGNVIAQSGGTERATIDAVLTDQDLGGYRSELRTTIRFGFLTEVQPEYYKRLTAGGLFVAPRLTFYRAPVYIYSNQDRVAEREWLEAGGGVDIGYSVSRYTEFRAGWQELTQRWHTQTGTDGQPDFNGHTQLAQVQYRFNGQDRALIPRRGLRVDASFGYQYDTVRSQSAPRLQTVAAYFRDIGHGNTLSLSGEGGSFFNRNIADPFRFTLGGPLRLAASSYDEYRGTDYFLVRPAYFRRIASLPAPLGQSIYVVGTYEAAQIGSPTTPTIFRQDVFFGLAAETPLGAVTFGPALGDSDHRKIVFTLGRFF